MCIIMRLLWNVSEVELLLALFSLTFTASCATIDVTKSIEYSYYSTLLFHTHFPFQPLAFAASVMMNGHVIWLWNVCVIHYKFLASYKLTINCSIVFSCPFSGSNRPRPIMIKFVSQECFTLELQCLDAFERIMSLFTVKLTLITIAKEKNE